jgi:HEAT repeat protein
MPAAKKGKTSPSDPIVARLLDDEDLDDHFAAREELATIAGPRREVIAEAVVAAATARTPRTVAIGVLGDLDGPRAVTALAALSVHRDEEVREEAVMALGELASRPAEAVSALVAALSDASEDVRDQAAGALVKYASPAAVEPLLSALARLHERPRWKQDVQVGGVLAALAASGPGDPRVLAVVLDHLIPGEKVIAEPAFAALVRIGPPAEGARRVLVGLAGGADAWMAIHAHRALIALGDPASDHLRAILEGLAVKDRDGSVNAAASTLLQDIGAAALPFVDAAVRDGKNPALRRAAERVRTRMTGGMGGGAKPAAGRSGIG